MSKKTYFILGIFMIFTLFSLGGCSVNINLPDDKSEPVSVDINKNKDSHQGQEENKNANNEQNNENNIDNTASGTQEEASANEQKCGDGTCENNEQNCCSDCGCEAGYFCGPDNNCQKSFVFKPLPLKSKTFFANPKISFTPQPVSPQAVGKIKAEAQGAATTQAPKIISGDWRGAVSPPSIYGNKIVFHKFQGAHPSIYMYDTISKVTTKIPYDGKAENPNMGAGFIVWQDYNRNLPENSDIYYYNFSDSEEGIISPRNEYQTTPKTYGKAIIWTEQADDIGSKALYMLWLPSRQETKIYYKRNTGITSYEIWGGSVVYTVDDFSDDTSYLYQYDIAKGKNNKLLKVNGESIHSAGVWNRKISYLMGSGDLQYLYVYDLDSKLTNKISKEGESRIDTAIFENKIVWADKRDGDDEIYLYDLDTKKESRLTNDDQLDRNPDIYGNYVVYKSGNMDIKLLTIN